MAGPTVLHEATVGSTTAGATSLSPTITAVTPGNLVVVAFAYYNSAVKNPSLSVSDSSSQTWTAGPTCAIEGATYGKAAMFYFPNSAAITTVSCASGASAIGAMAAVFWEVTGAAATTPADVSLAAPGGGSTGTAATGTAGSATAAANELALGGIFSGGSSITISGETAGWTPETKVQGAITGTAYDTDIFPAYQASIASGTTLTLAATLQYAVYWGVLFQTFKAAAAAAVVVPPPLVINQAALIRASIW